MKREFRAALGSTVGASGAAHSVDEEEENDMMTTELRDSAHYRKKNTKGSTKELQKKMSVGRSSGVYVRRG
jgi:hypothetical protein